MRDHLVLDHPENPFIREFVEVKKNMVQTTLENFKTADKLYTTDDLRELFEKLIWENNLPFTVCNSDSWKKIFQILNMKCVTSYECKKSLIEFVENERKALKDRLHTKKCFLSGTCDETKGTNDLQISCHTVCWADESLKMKNVVLSVHHCVGKTKVQQTAAWKETMLEFGISDEALSVMVCDGAEQYFIEYYGKIFIWCMVHFLDLQVKDLNKNEKFKESIKKGKQIVNKFNGSYKLTKLLKEQQEKARLPEKKLQKNVAHRFLTTYAPITGLCENWEFMKTIYNHFNKKPSDDTFVVTDEDGQTTKLSFPSDLDFKFYCDYGSLISVYDEMGHHAQKSSIWCYWKIIIDCYQGIRSTQVDTELGKDAKIFLVKNMEQRVQNLFAEGQISNKNRRTEFTPGLLRRLFLGKSLLLHPGYRVHITRIPKELGGPYSDTELKACKQGIMQDFDNISVIGILPFWEHHHRNPTGPTVGPDRSPKTANRIALRSIK